MSQTALGYKNDPEEIIDIDLLFVQRREVKKLQQDFSIPWGPQRYDPTTYLGSHEKCTEHENAQYIELHQDEDLKIICCRCLLYWYQRDYQPSGNFGYLVDQFLVNELCNRLEKAMKFFDTQSGESFIQETIIVCDEYCTEMQNYIAQVFDELYSTLVEIDPFEVKIAEDEGVFGQQQATELVENQILAELDRISSNVKYNYPIELVTVNKVIDVIDLDESENSNETTVTRNKDNDVEMQVQKQQEDEDLVVVDEIHHDLVLNSFFKMTSDSIQQVKFPGANPTSCSNFKDLYQQGFIQKQTEKVATLRQNCLSQIVPISDEACLIVGGASTNECIAVFNNVTCVQAGQKSCRKSPMNLARANFGCALSKQDRLVIVVGGQTSQFEQTARCEIYEVVRNTWTELPKIHKPLTNCSVIIISANLALGQKRSVRQSVVYNFGGVERTHESMSVSYVIERLYLSTPQTGWQPLSVSLPTNMCNFGCIQRRNAMGYSQIVIFGGWSLIGCNKAFLMRDDLSKQNQQLLEIKTPEGKDALETQDFFTCNGESIIISQNLDLISGGNQFHLFNHDTLQFTTL